MKRLILLLFLLGSFTAFSQFEQPQIKGDDFKNLNVKLGGDFALQYQVLNHHADSALIPLGTGFNLPTANLNIDVFLAKGIKLNLQTYLSSRHHNETWVKGGYLLFDELPFLNSDKIDKVMDYLTIIVGDMEINYGDAHFRRSDNGNVINNPFVGNYIMDAFTTAPSMEVMFRNKGILLMGAVTTGQLRQDLTLYDASKKSYTAYDALKELGFYWKASWDKNLNESLRTRLSLSGFHMPEANHRNTLYGGDRTGSRYYLVMNRQTFNSTDVDIKSNHLNTYFSPGAATKTNALMVNLFTQYKGLEFFGTYETATGLYPSTKEFKFNQLAAEGIYRFGKDDQFFAGARYNVVTGNKDSKNSASKDQKVDRIQVGAGWFLLKSTVIKLEYVKQNYTDFIKDFGADAGFNGIMFEAAVSF
ncbi:MAG: hypothetical protein HPY80_09305 [Bacteroidales bacterium]|jgi:hypothetical protein|nr:hypothetical protein [Bacteroidales bacterium]NPV36846.1 hypothetical protein [Bacteroidales bacterium]